MAESVNLLSYWMPILKNLKEFNEIAKAEEPELNLILEAIDRVLNNMFIETADEYGISRFEKMMKIFPEDGATLEERRFTVQVKWNETIPYTLESLKDQLTVLCGNDGYTVTMDYPNYSLTVKLSLENENSVKVVEELLDRVVPANIVTMVFLFNTHTVLSNFTHEQLSAYTHTELREETL